MDRRFKCSICNKLCSTIDGLVTHLKRHSQTREWTCANCAKQFLSKTELIRHLPVHSGDCRFPCDHCGVKLRSQAQLRIHTSAHLGHYKHACSECPARFVDAKTRKRHTAVHLGRREFACKRCTASYRSVAALKKHLRLHGESKSIYKCSTCQTEFNDAKTLSTHERKMHATVAQAQTSSNRTPEPKTRKEFRCRFCFAVFTVASSVTLHERIHVEDPRRRFRCAICRGTFKDKWKLVDHHCWHRGDKFVCPNCLVTLSSNGALSNHRRYFHSDAKPYECEFCTKTFSQPHRLKVHRRIHTGEKPFACKQCSKSFAYDTSLRVHILIHHSRLNPFGCCRCAQRFFKKSQLAIHMLSHVEDAAKRFGCATCGKYFRGRTLLRAHIHSKHDERRRFGCSVCPMLFRTQLGLTNHTIRNDHAWAHSDTGQRLAKASKRKPQEFFRCARCGWTMRQRGGLLVHLNAHLGMKCKFCTARFPDQVALFEHSRWPDRNKPFRCAICAALYRERKCLFLHIQGHATAGSRQRCESCHRAFNHAFELKNHRARIHSNVRPFVCQLCPAKRLTAFELKRHMRSHATKAEPERFVCASCLKRYTRKHYVVAHLRLSHLQ